MKKIYLFILTIISAVILLYGCGDKKEKVQDNTPAPAVSKEEQKIIDKAASDLDSWIHEKVNEKSYVYFDSASMSFIVGYISDIPSMDFNTITEASNYGIIDIQQLKTDMNWDTVRESMFAFTESISAQLAGYGFISPTVNLTLYSSEGTIAYMIFRNNVCTFDYLENFIPSTLTDTEN